MASILERLLRKAAERGLLDEEKEEKEDDGARAQGQEAEAPRTPLLGSFDLQGVARHIQAASARLGRPARVVAAVGAGVSVSAGIPDFRTPGTGLYDNLEKYDLPEPTAVFDIRYFRGNPAPFYMLAKELRPDNYAPTPAHLFLRLLHEKGHLQRVFTQNIDSLERKAGVPAERVVAAHGNFDGAACIECGAACDDRAMARGIADEAPVRCQRCDGLCKPNIVFFGEDLPQRFFRLSRTDFRECDLLIVMGTSLSVQPFASIVGAPDDCTPRLLVNREKVGERARRDPRHEALLRAMGYSGAASQDPGFDFDPETNYRDALFLGDCDAGCARLAEMLGWGDDLRALVREHGCRNDLSGAPARAEEEQATNADSGAKPTAGEADPGVEAAVAELAGLSVGDATAGGGTQHQEAEDAPPGAVIAD